jgi:hypothetical protein
MSESDPLLRWRENPFYLLGLDPSASELEVEREGRKLLAQLELGLAAVRVAHTPVGDVTRTPERVRDALAELRDSRKRKRHALWARLPVANIESPNGESSHNARAPWSEAMSAVGWPGL